MASSQAIDRQIDQQRHRVFTLAYYTLGSHQDAEDATQETLLRYWRNASRVAPDRVEGWLVRTTTNVCLDLIRKRKRSPETFGNEASEATLQAAASSSPGPSDRAVSAESRQQLERKLAELKEPFRSLLILREVQGMTYDQIADALELPLTSVRVYLHRGRRLLAQQLEASPHCSPTPEHHTPKKISTGGVRR
ncbi:RNA polymerase sigma factor [Botrimarina hoheduenensis]|uniref:ECF RNA polymerase sigma factor SigE n=1 Tax=Botrimarina hoheduenensis TaxID=2528000 RepID=A0A5C5W7A1_9BACT|nr:RNA polymerase sigma factor [Botrimarina hoheduenensis]TWT46748.1 ECF RNA polymerase sigma factor SigE [Botrimarina hoheduenensis]